MDQRYRDYSNIFTLLEFHIVLWNENRWLVSARRAAETTRSKQWVELLEQLPAPPLIHSQCRSPQQVSDVTDDQN